MKWLLLYLSNDETSILYLSPDSDVVHGMLSENGVVKVQRREERTLFSAEKAALAYSKIDRSRRRNR